MPIRDPLIACFLSLFLALLPNIDFFGGSGFYIGTGVKSFKLTYSGFKFYISCYYRCWNIIFCALLFPTELFIS